MTEEQKIVVQIAGQIAAQVSTKFPSALTDQKRAVQIAIATSSVTVAQLIVAEVMAGDSGR